MIILALAAQLTAPVPLRPLFTADDAPIGMVEHDVLHTVGVALTVKPDGKVQGCQVEESSRNPKLDSYTCRLVARRARFQPPRQMEGSPAYALYRTRIKWWVGEGLPPSGPALADLYVSVSRLPSNVKSPVLVRLKFAVDAGGRASHCVADEAQDDSILVRLACDQLLKSYKPSPVRTAEGAAVSSVQTGTVLFHTN